jgi:branched-chain amino acid transport system substrate-binding protein
MTTFFGLTAPLAPPPRIMPAFCSDAVCGARHWLLMPPTAPIPIPGSLNSPQNLQELGGVVSATEGFDSSAVPSFANVLKKLLVSQPDSLLFIASSLDTARLCQQARQLAPGLALSSTEWAASGELLSEMGGDAVEGLLIAHAYDRDDPGPGYKAFREAFKSRFQRDFGSFSVLAYDTANVAITALRKRSKDESIKTALLKHGPYQGLQQPIQFDANGDALRKVFFTEITGGRFTQIK